MKAPTVFKLFCQLLLPTIVCEAMDKYWREKSKEGLGEWHFYKVSVIENLRKYNGKSEVLQRIMNEKNNLPFMN